MRHRAVRIVFLLAAWFPLGRAAARDQDSLSPAPTFEQVWTYDAGG